MRAFTRYIHERIQEGKQAVKMTRLSCHRIRGNEVRLWLSIFAYNLGNLWLAGVAICCRIKKMNS